MRKFLYTHLIFVMILLHGLWGGVNPFVLFNDINHSRAFIPLPSTQVIQSDHNSSSGKLLCSNQHPLWVLIEPSERLVLEAKRYQGEIKAQISLDGRLYQTQKLQPKIASDGKHYYGYTNPYNQIVAIRLTAPKTLELEAMTTLNISALHKLQPRSIDLGGQKQWINCLSESKSVRYERFVKPQTFSFTVEGEGSLEIEMLTPLHALSITPVRNRIRLRHNEKKPVVLESLEEVSLNTLQENNESNASKVTHGSKHYIALEEGNNTIEIETYGDILLLAKRYHKSVVNSINERDLTWHLPDTLRAINQPQWKNSASQDGLKRMERILAFKEHIEDSIEQNALISTAQKGTALQPLYPYRVANSNRYLQGYYAIYRLYGSKELDRLSVVDKEDRLSYLSQLKEGLFVDVPTQKGALHYRLREPLTYPRELEVTLLGEGNCTLLITSSVAKEELSCIDNEKIEAKSFSKALFVSNEDNLSDQLNLLKNRSNLSILSPTGTMRITLPKGTDAFSLYRPSDSAQSKVALRIRQESRYHDTPYHLATHYHRSYRAFAQSLYQGSLKAFDPWYEATHPLRLWMQSRIDKAKEHLTNTSTPDRSRLLYANYLYTQGDRYTAMQVAKHILFLSDDNNLQKEAYQLLLKLSENNDQLLRWHSAYFYLRASSDTLSTIAQLLQEEGEYALSLMARLLVDKKAQTKDLAILQNNFELAYYLKVPQEHNDLAAKAKLLDSPSYRFDASKKGVNVIQSAGMERLYSISRDLYLHYHRATPTQPLVMEVEGTLELDVRFLEPPKSYQWLSIEIDHKPYHYALTATQASNGLRTKPENKAVSIANSLKITLPKGRHKVILHGYDQDLLIDTRARMAKEYPSLSKQLLQTSNPKLCETLPLDDNRSDMPYLNALLWCDERVDETKRYAIRAQAWRIAHSDKRLLSQYDSALLRILNTQSRFPNYYELETPYGFYDKVTSPWSPLSTLQQNRTPLLGDVGVFDRVITGVESHTIYLQGDQNLSIQATQITPKYLPSEPLCFGIKADNEMEEKLCFDANHSQWEYSFELSQEEHAISIRLLDPLSTHYLGVKFLVDGKAIDAKRTQRFYETRREHPIKLYEMGPALLRIEEDNGTQITTRYLMLPDPKEYTTAIPPSNNAPKALIRIAKMEIDPTLEALRTLEYPQVIKPQQNGATTIELQRAFIKPSAKKAIFQSIESTYSIGYDLLSAQLDRDDDIDTQNEQVSQISLYRRQKLDDNLYWRQHYFVRLYDNPLYGFRHRLSMQLPYWNLWSYANLNFYQQESGSTFQNLHLSTEVVKKDTFDERWRMHYTLGLNRYFLNYDNPSFDPLDPLVYSRYRRDHQLGGYFIYQLFYAPYDDLHYDMRLGFYSNEQLNILDHINLKLKMDHLLYPFDLSLYYEGRYYFEDRDRPDDYTINRIGANIAYNRFMGNNRLELELGALHTFENHDTQITFGIRWHFSGNKIYHNFMPSETSFKDLRLLQEDAQGEWK